jgi:predicted negative regulator of RcsB-dependent stress response
MYKWSGGHKMKNKKINEFLKQNGYNYVIGIIVLAIFSIYFGWILYKINKNIDETTIVS